MVFSLSHTQKTGLKTLFLTMLVMGSFAVHVQQSGAVGCPGACGPGTYCSAAGTCVPTSTTGGKPLLIPKGNLRLLQPLDDTTTSLPPSAGILIFFVYFDIAWPWILGIAAGVGVLQALVGGVQIMLSGSDSGMRESGKGKIMWALAGLLMVGLAGFILRSINPLFYR